MLAFLSHLRLPTPFLSCLPVPAFLSHPPIPALLSHSPVFALSFLFMPVLSSLLVPALLSLPVLALSSYFVFGPAQTRFTSSALKTFKQAFSEELLGRQSTSFSSLEPLCPFSILNLLPEKSDCKWFFDMVFSKSCLFAANHIAEEIDLSLGKCKCLILVKLN